MKSFWFTGGQCLNLLPEEVDSGFSDRCPPNGRLPIRVDLVRVLYESRKECDTIMLRMEHRNLRRFATHRRPKSPVLYSNYPTHKSCVFDDNDAS